MQVSKYFAFHLYLVGLCEKMRLFLSKQFIHNPASPNMLPFASAMGDDFLIVANGVQKCIGKNGHTVKCLFLVNAVAKSTTVDVSQRGSMVMGRKRLPKISRIMPGNNSHSGMS
jgi:hypothetical protein